MLHEILLILSLIECFLINESEVYEIFSDSSFNSLLQQSGSIWNQYSVTSEIDLCKYYYLFILKFIVWSFPNDQYNPNGTIIFGLDIRFRGWVGMGLGGNTMYQNDVVFVGIRPGQDIFRAHDCFTQTTRELLHYPICRYPNVALDTRNSVKILFSRFMKSWTPFHYRIRQGRNPIGKILLSSVTFG